MTSCTIIVSHYQSLPFLKTCLRQIEKYKHPEIEQHIIFADQSGSEYYSKYEIELLRSELDNRSDITFFNMLPYYSGFGIDWLMRYADIQTDYMAQIHVDAMPIHKNWLYLPITLIEEYNVSSVGQLQCICDGTQSIYPPSPFFAMAQCFNVARTETYREMSMEAGFTRFHQREYAGFEYNNNDWFDWAAKDYRNRGSDDDIIAFAWEDKYREHDKLGLAITGYIEPSFGRIIEDIVFHFCSARESVGVIEKMPELYQWLTKEINKNYSDELLNEMIAIAKAHKPPELKILSRNHWDGELKISNPPSFDLNKRIEELKHE